MTKEEVLSLLLTASEPVSGEHICRQLGVTRAAVWKAIDQLRQEGYTIEAAPRRGYTLTARPDRLDTAQVRGYLAGHPWQPLVTAVERVDSTNNACKRLAAEGASDGTAVLTGMQTAGRGRRGRTFVSPPGGLYFSLILRPHAQPEALMHLTAMVAVAAPMAARADPVARDTPRPLAMASRASGTEAIAAPRVLRVAAMPDSSGDPETSAIINAPTLTAEPTPRPPSIWPRTSTTITRVRVACGTWPEERWFMTGTIGLGGCGTPGGSDVVVLPGPAVAVRARRLS